MRNGKTNGEHTENTETKECPAKAEAAAGVGQSAASITNPTSIADPASQQ